MYTVDSWHKPVAKTGENLFEIPMLYTNLRGNVVPHHWTITSQPYFTMRT